MVSSLLQKMLLSPMIRLFNRCHHARLSSRATSGCCTALIFVVLITGLFSCSDGNIPAVPQLPATLGSLELKDTVVGVEAKKFLYRMHGALTGSRNCIIGYYGLAKKNALYISAFTDDERAERALEKMLAKIEHSNGRVRPRNSGEERGPSLIPDQGYGTDHFFYRQGNLILWWQVEPGRAEETLTRLLNENFTLH